jgi:hypothetical protein
VVTASGSAIAFVKSSKGASTASATDTPILPGTAQTFAIQADHDTVSVFCATTVDMYFTVGNGA